MFQYGLFILRCLVVTGTLFSISLFATENPKAAVLRAPIPRQIINRKKVFVAYAGVSSSDLSGYITSHAGTATGLYDEFYAAIENWGKYELVSDPGDADLVLEISLQGRSQDDPMRTPDFRLRILDPKTHIVLWAFVENASARVKQWNQGLEKLVDDLQALTVGQPDAVGAQSK